MISRLVKPLGAPFGLDSPSADRKRLVLILRSLVVATAAYLVFDGAEWLGWAGFAYVFLFAASNGALALVPARVFLIPTFGPLLFLADTAVILLGLSWGQGFSQELLVAYFFTLFLVTAGETLGQIAVGSALIAGLYGYWMASAGGAGAPVSWVRLPFFFFVAVFYASLIEQLKRERHRRREAEEENRHLRLVLDLANSFSEEHPSRDFVLSLGRFIEVTCPALECRIVLDGGDEVSGDGETFVLRAHGRCYGCLSVSKIGAGSLSTRERWLCQIVVHAAAGALYAAETTSASESAEETKEQFLAVLSHELRTPLHAILGYVEMLGSLLSDDSDPMVREGLGRARANAERLQGLLEDLFSFTEIRSGHSSIRCEPVELGALIEQVVTTTRTWVGEKPVMVACDLPACDLVVRTDDGKLRRALSCLLSNAVKFTEAGRITVRASPVGHARVDVSIEDTGIGIAPSDLALIFDEFRQVDGSTTRPYGGLGIGLPLARGIVCLLGGTMEVDSRVGHGTSVRLALPLCGPRESGEASRQPSEASAEFRPGASRTEASHRVRGRHSLLPSSD